jgi:hypothetical protein
MHNSKSLTPKLREFLQPQLTDEQWQKIVSLIDLPLEARDELDVAIRRYKSSRNKYTPTAAETRTHIKKMQQGCLPLFATLINDLDNQNLWLWRDLYDATNAAPDEDAYILMITEMIATHNLLDRLVTKGFDSLWSKRGNPYKNLPRKLSDGKVLRLYELVKHLDFVCWHYTKKRVSRSSKRDTEDAKEFVIFIAKISDPEVSDGSIDAAMKKVIASRTDSPAN